MRNSASDADADADRNPLAEPDRDALPYAAGGDTGSDALPDAAAHTAAHAAVFDTRADAHADAASEPFAYADRDACANFNSRPDADPDPIFLADAFPDALPHADANSDASASDDAASDPDAVTVHDAAGYSDAHADAHADSDTFADMRGMIFVQIAAYRDPDLAATVDSCIANAVYPEKLRFGIVAQVEPGDPVEMTLIGHPIGCLHEIRHVAARESRGLGWARSLTQEMYEGEEWTLQIDAHHRFAWGWDVKLIAEAKLTMSPKPIITAYAGVLDEKLDPSPFKMVADKFTSGGTILFRPHYIPDWQRLERPLRARFVSGHYFFAPGSHCDEYRYDPEIYFAGDEISLAVRSFTLGYDLFHPHRCYLWHEYTRKNRVKHWDDHVRGSVETPWHERDDWSKRRLRQLLGEDDYGIDLEEFGLGDVRSMSDYEHYAGIDFASRMLSLECLAGDEPRWKS